MKHGCLIEEASDGRNLLQRIPSNSSLSYHILSFLSHPFLSNPILSNHTPSYPVLSHYILSYPILPLPILRHVPHLLLSYHITIISMSSAYVFSFIPEKFLPINSNLLSLQLLYQAQNPGLKVQYDIKRNDGSVALKFQWHYGSWSTCSVTCGQGMKTMKNIWFYWKSNEFSWCLLDDLQYLAEDFKNPHRPNIFLKLLHSNVQSFTRFHLV